jgi:hypothetical protein
MTNKKIGSVISFRNRVSDPPFYSHGPPLIKKVRIVLRFTSFLNVWGRFLVKSRSCTLQKPQNSPKINYFGRDRSAIQVNSCYGVSKECTTVDLLKKSHAIYYWRRLEAGEFPIEIPLSKE